MRAREVLNAHAHVRMCTCLLLRTGAFKGECGPARVVARRAAKSWRLPDGVLQMPLACERGSSESCVDGIVLSRITAKCCETVWQVEMISDNYSPFWERYRQRDWFTPSANRQRSQLAPDALRCQNAEGNNGTLRAPSSEQSLCGSPFPSVQEIPLVSPLGARI